MSETKVYQGVAIFLWVWGEVYGSGKTLRLDDASLSRYVFVRLRGCSMLLPVGFASIFNDNGIARPIGLCLLLLSATSPTTIP